MPRAMYVARQALWAMVAAALLGGLCAGCTQGTFTRARYETIIIGTSRESEVEETLGRPASKSPNTWTYTHKRPWYQAEIHFKDGVVADKAWYDEKQDMQSPVDRGVREK